MSVFERVIEWRAAFDRRDPDPRKNYGIHGVEIKFVLKGELGVTQFLLYTNWNLPHVQEELDALASADFPHLSCHPLPADLGHHWRTPRYAEQQRMDCDYVEGGCYYDGSGLNAEPVYLRLVEEGDAGVWTALEDYYNRLAMADDPEEVPVGD